MRILYMLIYKNIYVYAQLQTPLSLSRAPSVPLSLRSTATCDCEHLSLSSCTPESPWTSLDSVLRLGFSLSGRLPGG